MAISDKAFDKLVLEHGSFGSWKIQRRLGNGGMGIVYLGNKTALNGETLTVALKIISPKDFLDEESNSRELFAHEYDVLSKLNSPYIPRIIDSGIEAFVIDGKTLPLPWFAMQEITGEDLGAEIRKHGPLNEGDWFDLANDLMTAITVAHSQEIIHKDVKPENVMRFSRRSVLVDFGGASFVDRRDPGDIGVWTPVFAAPEQHDGRTHPELLQYPVDLFAAGATLVFAATGKAPWDAPTDAQVNALSPKNHREGQAAFAKLFFDKKTTTPTNLTGLSQKQLRIVRPLLEADPAKRGTAENALKAIKLQLPYGSTRKKESAFGTSSQEFVAAVRSAAKASGGKASAGKEPSEGRARAAAEIRERKATHDANPGDPRDFLTTWLFAILLGWLGVDRFYMGKIGTGILKLLTFGGWGIWSLIDIIIVTSGNSRDHWGRPLNDEKNVRLKVRWWTIPIIVVIVVLFFWVNITNAANRTH